MPFVLTAVAMRNRKIRYEIPDISASLIKLFFFLYLKIRKYFRVEHMRSDFSSYKLCINIYGVYMETLAMRTSSFSSDRQIYINIYIVSMVFVSVLFLVRRF